MGKYKSVVGLLLLSGFCLTVNAAEPNIDETIPGKVCSIKHSPGGSNYKWSIQRFGIETGDVSTVFGVNNNRKIQSVACRQNTDTVLFSMKEVQGGDFEIYELDPDRETPLKQLTHNDTDDVDVTVSRDGTVMAYQKRLSDGRQAISLTTSDENWTYPEKTLASASPFVQPSLSPNGRWLVFVQLRPSFFALMRYDRLLNQYTEVRKVPRRKKLYHPSVSDDGNIIGWTENKSQNRYLIKNLAENTVTQVINDADGIEHATVSADGYSVAYSINSDLVGEMQLLNLNTYEMTTVATTTDASDRYLSTQWQEGLAVGVDQTNSTVMLVNSSVVAKDTIYPDTNKITLQFSHDVDAEALEQGVYFENVSTGEMITIGDGTPVSWTYDETIYKDNDGTLEEIDLSASNGCRPGTDEVCVTVTNKKLVYLAISPLDWEAGAYRLHVSIGMQVNQIPFDLAKPQSFFVDYVGQYKDTSVNEAEYFYRVFNDNAATQFSYDFNIEGDVSRSRSIEIGESNGVSTLINGGNILIGKAYAAKTGVGSGFVCIPWSDVCEVSSTFVENEVNYSLVRFTILNNSPDQPLLSPVRLELCSDSSECHEFSFDVNVPENPNFLP